MAINLQHAHQHGELDQYLKCTLFLQGFIIYLFNFNDQLDNSQLLAKHHYEVCTLLWTRYFINSLSHCFSFSYRAFFLLLFRVVKNIYQPAVDVVDDGLLAELSDISSSDDDSDMEAFPHASDDSICTFTWRGRFFASFMHHPQHRVLLDWRQTWHCTACTSKDCQHCKEALPMLQDVTEWLCEDNEVVSSDGESTRGLLHPNHDDHHPPLGQYRAIPRVFTAQQLQAMQNTNLSGIRHLAQRTFIPVIPLECLCPGPCTCHSRCPKCSCTFDMSNCTEVDDQEVSHTLPIIAYIS
jgi:hypothetical protein